MLRSVLLGTTAFLLALPASAGQNGLYVGLEGGASFVQTMDGFEINNGFTTFFERIELDTGWAVLATVGYEWDNWRVEGEVGYRRNDMESIRFDTGFVSTDVDDLSQLTLMANLIYDIALMPNMSLSLGAGAGLDRLTFDWPGFGQPGGVEGDDWSLAYQGIVGLGYAFDPSCEAFVNYRYLSADQLDFTDRNNRQHFEDIGTHTVSAGVRYSFGR